MEEMDETSFKLQKITRNTTVSESFSADTSNDADMEEMDSEEVQPDDVEDDNGQVGVVDDEEDGKEGKEEGEDEEEKVLDEKKKEKAIEAELKRSRASYSIKLAQQLAKEAEEQKRADALPPRAGGVIKVSFNKREFKHPARESKKEEEEEWLRKQAKAKAAKKKLLEEDGDMDYKEVERKAKTFYQVGDLGSALEVLNQGLRLFPESAALWSKKTTVQISLKKWEQALEDSEIALRLLQPEVSCLHIMIKVQAHNIPSC